MLSRAVLTSLLVVSGGCAEVVVVPLPEDLPKADPKATAPALYMVMKYDGRDWLAQATPHEDGSWTFPYRPPDSVPDHVLQYDCGESFTTDEAKANWTEMGQEGAIAQEALWPDLLWEWTESDWGERKTERFGKGLAWSVVWRRTYSWTKSIGPPPPVIWQGRVLFVVSKPCSTEPCPVQVQEVQSCDGSLTSSLAELIDSKVGNVLALAVDPPTLYLLNDAGVLFAWDPESPEPMERNHLGPTSGSTTALDGAALAVRGGLFAAMVCGDAVEGCKGYYAQVGSPTVTSIRCTQVDEVRPSVAMEENVGWLLCNDHSKANRCGGPNAEDCVVLDLGPCTFKDGMWEAFGSDVLGLWFSGQIDDENVYGRCQWDRDSAALGQDTSSLQAQVPDGLLAVGRDVGWSERKDVDVSINRKGIDFLGPGSFHPNFELLQSEPTTKDFAGYVVDPEPSVPGSVLVIEWYRDRGISIRRFQSTACPALARCPSLD